VVVLEEDPEATVMVMVSLAPEVGVAVAAERVVVEAIFDVVEVPTVTVRVPVEAA
jgi:hypothetical protein